MPSTGESAGGPEAKYQLFHAALPVKRPRKLLLVNPPQVPADLFRVDIARLKGYYAFPPVGLLYIAAVARAALEDVEIAVIDLNFELLKRCHEPDFDYGFWKDLLRDAIASEPSVHVGITCMFGATKPIFLEIASWVREQFPGVPLLVGGVQASYDWREILDKRCADVVFLRESETSAAAFFRNCARATKGERCEPSPGGIVFRLGDELCEVEGGHGHVPSPNEIDLDIRPYYSLIPIADYYRYGSLAAFSRFNGEEKPFATVLTNRGCRAQCTFCTVRDFNGPGVRARDIDRVVDEIEFLVRRHGIKQIDWLDDDLLFNPKRTIALLKAIVARVPELEWICNNGLIGAAIKPDTMEWMVRSGMKAFKIGIESGNDSWLRKIKKPTTKERLVEVGELFKLYPEVLVSGNFIIGFPRETFGEMLDTFEFARQLSWDWASFYICQPLKGTAMFSVFQALGDERCDYENYDKTLNPGRAAVRGEFGYYKGYHADGGPPPVRAGRDVFQIPRDQVPTKEQIKEIWFTFNLIANFLENKNLAPGGNAGKIVRWFESIFAAYPNDASMAAVLAHGWKRLGDAERQRSYRTRFDAILAESDYWRWRVEQFPELLELAR